MTSKLTFCTVITRNRLRCASALFESLKRTQSDFDFYALAVDGLKEDKLEIRTGFKVICPQTISCGNFDAMKVYYSAFELCNALRPVFVKYLMGQGAEKVVYLDSDIFVTGSFQKIHESLSEKIFMFTPHILTPYPLDKKFPDDFTVLGYGIYNSGFFAFRSHKKSHEILDFMAERFEKYCFDDPPFLFVDQKWFPLIVHLYREDFYLLDDPAYNVAYWNLHERKIEKRKDGFYVNGAKAVFFHLSGFDEKKPELFTNRGTRSDKAKPEMVSRTGPRFTVENYPVLSEIIKEYTRLLAQAPSDWPEDYRYDFFEGERLTPEKRRAYFKSVSAE